MTTPNAKPFYHKEYSLMKFIVGLSSCALVALSSSPSLATNRAISSSTIRPLSHQSLPAGIKTIQVAESLNSLLKGINTIDRIQQRSAAEQRKQDTLRRQQENREAAEQRKQERETRQQIWRDQAEAGRAERIQRAEKARIEREARIAAARKRQAEIAAAQAAKAEKQRRYWNSLTPKQQEEILAKQRARQAVGAAILIQMLGNGMSGGSSEPSTSSQQGQDDASDRIRAQQQRDRQAERDREPAPAPVTPIGGSCGLYGNGPCF
jgi:hypothetical protein